MTKVEHKRFARYLRWLANELGLRDWTFQVQVGCDEDAYAEVHCTTGRKIALVKLCPEFSTLDPETQREVLIHEIIHCHFASAQAVVCDDLCEHLSQAVYDTLWAGYARQVEYAVDGIASSIADRYPLPKS